MATCLSDMKCPEENQHYAVLCEFWVGNTEYTCNPETTCIRDDSGYACCAEDITTCTISTIYNQPTPHPTSTGIIYPLSCIQTCNSIHEIQECQWYESRNLQTTCYDEFDNLTCCSHIRSECCPFRQEGFNNIIAILVVVFICICLIVYYSFYITMKYNELIIKRNKVYPESV